MKHSRCTWLSMIVAVGAMLATVMPSLRADEKTVTVTGHLTKLQAGGQHVVLTTSEGKKLNLVLDNQSKVRRKQQNAKLTQFQEGDRVRVTYEPRDGTNRVVSLTSAPVTAAEVRQEFQKALAAAKSYTFQQKDEYEKRLQPVLHDLDERIKDLQAQLSQAGEQARQRLAPEIAKLQQQRKVVQQRLDKIKAASPAAWEDIKAGVSSAVDDLQKAFERASSRFPK